MVVTRDPADLPSQVLAEPDQVVGQSVTGPVASGEIITSVRLRGRSMLTGQPPGMVAVGIPLGDTSLVGAVHPGDAVTVHTAGAGAPVAQGTVLSVRMAEPSAISGQAGSASVVLAVPESDVAAIAAGAGLVVRHAGFVLAARCTALDPSVTVPVSAAGRPRAALRSPEHGATRSARRGGCPQAHGLPQPWVRVGTTPNEGLISS